MVSSFIIFDEEGQPDGKSPIYFFEKTQLMELAIKHISHSISLFTLRDCPATITPLSQHYPLFSLLIRNILWIASCLH